jgi:hypothetical protein
MLPPSILVITEVNALQAQSAQLLSRRLNTHTLWDLLECRR